MDVIDKTPDYYRQSGETIDKQEELVEDLVSMGVPPARAFDAATAVKYLDRGGEKGDPVGDRGKAANYLFRYANGRWPWEQG